MTFATLLKDAGYHTYAAGKWDPGTRPGQLPIDHGFEKSFVLAAGGACHFDDMAGLTRPVAVVPYYENDRKVEKLPEDFYSSEFYTDRIIDYIDSKRPGLRPLLESARLALNPQFSLDLPEWCSGLLLRGKQNCPFWHPLVVS